MTSGQPSLPARWCRCRPLMLLSIFLILQAGLCQAQAEPVKFPEYKVISDNVRFWEKVYSTHSVNTAIIHDQYDLSVVYATVDLLEDGFANASKHNREKIRQVKRHIESVLLELAASPSPRTREQKRIAALFTNTRNGSVYKKASGNIRSQRGLKERFLEGVIRSGAYMIELKKIFRSLGLPEDLTYLPHVESSFNPRAFSKFGAAGMWQFTHDT
ncbi:MAG: transglycosylase SLT domain-containing protein, partial [Desulfocapsaceae bacterium]|nr:transglycosylase SLT domain-containing protein [Desulfocapsaceae bacterium]